MWSASRLKEWWGVGGAGGADALRSNFTSSPWKSPPKNGNGTRQSSPISLLSAAEALYNLEKLWTQWAWPWKLKEGGVGPLLESGGRNRVLIPALLMTLDKSLIIWISGFWYVNVNDNYRDDRRVRDDVCERASVASASSRERQTIISAAIIALIKERCFGKWTTE